jgi:hypothetical protein
MVRARVRLREQSMQLPLLERERGRERAAAPLVCDTAERTHARRHAQTAPQGITRTPVGARYHTVENEEPASIGQATLLVLPDAPRHLRCRHPGHLPRSSVRNGRATAALVAASAVAHGLHSS